MLGHPSRPHGTHQSIPRPAHGSPGYATRRGLCRPRPPADRRGARRAAGRRGRWQRHAHRRARGEPLVLLQQRWVCPDLARRLGGRSRRTAATPRTPSTCCPRPILRWATQARSIMDDTGAKMSMIGTESAEVGAVPVPPGHRHPRAVDERLVRQRDPETHQRHRQRAASRSMARSTTRSSPWPPAMHTGTTSLLHGDSLSIQARVYLFTVGDDGVVILFGSDPTLAASVGSGHGFDHQEPPLRRLTLADARAADRRRPGRGGIRGHAPMRRSALRPPHL